MLDHEKRSGMLMRRPRGFTLVETMIVVVILGVIMLVALPNLTEWIGSMRLRFKAEGMLSGISQARSQALKHNARVFFRLGQDAGWTVGCVTADANDRDGDGFEDCPAVIEQKSAAEDAGGNVQLAITPDDGTDAIVYNGVGRVVGAAITRIDFSSTDTSVVWSVVISGSGDARVCSDTFNGTGNTYACS
jgi:type IV fimbrial biogenesis protein FimT